MAEPASIRYRNPGAMWGGNAISKKWGEMGNVSLNDGTGQGNRIAVFPTYVHGICAQIDLWRTSRYRNKRFADAIRVWSGGNHVSSYIAFVKARVPGMTEDTIINDAFLNSPMGIKFLKAQAWHEAGKPYPAPDADWVAAQQRVFGNTSTQLPAPKPTTKPSSTKKGTGSVIVGGGAGATAHELGLSIGWVIAIAGAVAVATFLAANKDARTKAFSAVGGLIEKIKGVFK